MTELNELTKRLFTEGWTKENHPNWVKDFNKWYGGFEYTIEAQRKLVFETPCGLLVKGSHWNTGYMSYMGVDWTIENYNPTLNCPYRNDNCVKRHKLLQEKAHGTGRMKIVFCDCHLTSCAYDYEKSIDKILDEQEERKAQLHKEFTETHRSCPFQDSFNEIKGKWQLRYDPFTCATNICQYCSVLRRDLSDKKGNVFYDLKTTRRGEDKGLFTQEYETQIIKGKRLFEKNINLTIAEIIAKSFKYKIREKVNMKYHAELFFNEYYGKYFKVEVLNVRAEKRVSRDLEQDLKDIAEGYTVSHESDLIAEEKEQKRIKRDETQNKKAERLIKTVFEKGYDRLNDTELRRLKKFTRNGLIDLKEINEADKNGKKQRQIQQLSLFQGEFKE